MTHIQKNCEACGDLIEVRLADHKRGWGRFCDKACAAAHKTGQRPRDVNLYHAKCQNGHGWAADKLRDFERKYGPNGSPPKAEKVKDQLGKKVKITPLYHSPANCRKCGAAVNGPGLCDDCEIHEEALNDIERGWDGHKYWGE